MTIRSLAVCLVFLLGFASVSEVHAASLESGVLAEVNYARTHPRDYARELRRYRDSFDGYIAHPDNDPVGVQTHEGPSAVDEAIDFLEAQRPLPPLAASALLARGAGDLVSDQGPRGTIGHFTSGGRNPGQRVRQRNGDIYVSEVISYGQPDPAGVVRQLIIDDGVRRRGHRVLLFSSMFGFAGVSCGGHEVYGSMCVVDLSATRDGGAPMPRDRN